MKRRIIALLVTLLITIVPMAAFAGTAEIVSGDASITMDIPGGDVAAEDINIISWENGEKLASIHINGEYIKWIDVSYEDIDGFSSNKCMSREEAEALAEHTSGETAELVKADNGKWFVRDTYDGDSIYYYTVMDNGLVACVEMYKTKSGGYEVSLIDDAVAEADEIIKSYEDTGIYLQCGNAITEAEKIATRIAIRNSILIGLAIIIAVIIAYVIIKKYRARAKEIEQREAQKEKVAYREPMDAFISEYEPDGIRLLTVGGYYGKMSHLSTFTGTLTEKVVSCMEYMKKDVIKEAKASDGITRVNYNEELLESLVVSGLATADEGNMYIRISESELTVAIPCEANELKEAAAEELCNAGYDVFSISDIAKNQAGVTIKFDEEKKICYFVVPVNTYFEISDEMRSLLNYASRGGHHHAFS